MCLGLYIGMNSVQDVDPNWDTDYATERTLCDLNSRKLKKWADSGLNKTPDEVGAWSKWADEHACEFDIDGVYRGPSPAPTATPLPRPAPPSPPYGG